MTEPHSKSSRAEPAPAEEGPGRAVEAPNALRHMPQLALTEVIHKPKTLQDEAGLLIGEIAWE